jgi:arginase
VPLEANVDVDDWGDVPGFRWRVDRMSPRAMNAEHVVAVARAVGNRVERTLSDGAAVLVLGGDCTVELGTVAGTIAGDESVGLIYFDLDTDLNTPESTADGALDWMGVAHLLDLPGVLPVLSAVGSETPMLRPDQLLFFANGNVTPFERTVIQNRGIREIPFQDVITDPGKAAQTAIADWGRQFERLLVHLDVDVLDFVDLPLAENNRRNCGLRFEQLIGALRPLLQAPNWIGLTITEINPDHGESDGSTLRAFIEALTDTLSLSPALSGHRERI